LSQEYIAAKEKLKWRCINGHEWEAIFGIIKNGSWCAKCAGNFISKEDGILKAKKHAELKDGICLSTNYIKSSEKLKWKCVNNHIWEATYNSVVSRNSWCSVCAGRFSKEDGLKKANEYANNKNGICLSDKYVNAHKKLKWKCHVGHVWEASWNQISSKKHGVLNVQLITIKSIK